MNKDILVKVGLLLGGALIGSLITKSYLDKKYCKIINEEYERGEEIRKNAKCENSKKQNDQANYKEKYEKMIEALKYAEEKGDDKMIESYVIKPEAYGEYPNYGFTKFLYFPDGYLTDDKFNEIEDDSFLPEDYADFFGEYDDEDTVYVENDYLKMYYAIYMQPITYHEVIEGSNE